MADDVAYLATALRHAAVWVRVGLTALTQQVMEAAANVLAQAVPGSRRETPSR